MRRKLHSMEVWAKVLDTEENNWYKKLLRIIRFIPPSEIHFDSYGTKPQSNWMCGPYYQRSACLYY